MLELVQAADPRKDDGSTLLAAGTKLGARVRKATTTARGLRPQASILVAEGWCLASSSSYLRLFTMMTRCVPIQAWKKCLLQHNPMATACYCRESRGSSQIGAPSFDLSRSSEEGVHAELRAQAHKECSRVASKMLVRQQGFGPVADLSAQLVRCRARVG